MASNYIERNAWADPEPGTWSSAFQRANRERLVNNAAQAGVAKVIRDTVNGDGPLARVARRAAPNLMRGLARVNPVAGAALTGAVVGGAAHRAMPRGWSETIGGTINQALRNVSGGRLGNDDSNYMMSRYPSPAPVRAAPQTTAPAPQRGVQRMSVTPYQGSLKSQFDQALGFDQYIPPAQAMATPQEGNARLNALYNRSLGLRRA